ncbi:MAG: right-handed parallel beta-helix repeat-containing protein [Casimicrobiaceae bacterium]
MKKGSFFRMTLGAVVMAAGIGDAFAAAQRTFVASNGVDTNPCTLTQPCRSFTRAISQTSAAGEVIVVDSAGYGPVAITQSVSIVAPPGIYAGVTVSSGTGITVNAAGIDVALRGLTINGQGGSVGIAFTQGKSLVVERCIISGMSFAGIDILGALSASIADVRVERGGSFGIRIGTFLATPTRVTVQRAAIVGNFTAGIQAGTAGGGAVRVSVADSELSGNGIGIDAFADNDSGSNTYVYASRNVIANNSGDGIFSGSAGSGHSLVYSVDNVITTNGGSGISVFQALGQVVVSGSTVSGNLGGFIHSSGGGIFTLKNNIVRDNATNIDAGGTNLLTFD